MQCKKRGKRGFILYEAFEILFAAAVVLILFSFAYRAGTGLDFEKVYLSRDIALTMNALYGVPGDAVIDYQNPYLRKFTEYIHQGRVDVYENNPDMGAYYYYVQSKSSAVDSRFEKPEYLSFTKTSGRIEISRERAITGKTACAALDTSVDVKTVKIVLDPGHYDAEKGYTADALEEYKLTKQAADTVALVCKSKGYDCRILQQTDIISKETQIKDIVPGMVISLHTGSDPVNKNSNPVVVRYVLGYEKSSKLSCILNNILTEKFDSVAAEAADMGSIDEGNPLAVLNPQPENPDVFPAVQIEIGNIYNKNSFSSDNIANMATSIISAIEEYYSKSE